MFGLFRVRSRASALGSSLESANSGYCGLVELGACLSFVTRDEKQIFSLLCSATNNRQLSAVNAENIQLDVFGVGQCRWYGSLKSVNPDDFCSSLGVSLGWFLSNQTTASQNLIAIVVDVVMHLPDFGRAANRY